MKITNNGGTDCRYGFDASPNLKVKALIGVCGVVGHCEFTCDNGLQTSRAVAVIVIRIVNRGKRHRCKQGRSECSLHIFSWSFTDDYYIDVNNDDNDTIMIIK